ncbi:serine hydrolase [Bisbaumannia pacifica]|uniref:Serine hydrolase n=1 Tax=Bisbaumannia pacifica TaxID=77098 RepID=A0ABD4L297_9GAMM|nr:serine hydrolase [Halomonas pacifica]MBH8580844.1 serine hydrolase [Halomonas pacifica]
MKPIYKGAAGRWLVPVLLLVGLALATTSVQANPRYAAIVVDATSGEVLHAANAEAPRYPASLTKMMTLYLLFEALDEGRLSLDQPLPVSRQAAAMPASKLWLAAGDSIPVRDAIPALIIRSANDVAVVVAEALGGSEAAFAQMMTAKARELGMLDTRFRNASGLPDDLQVTTARDMANLAVRLMADFPHYYDNFGRTRFSFRGNQHNGHNRLLSNYDGADGLKTGFIRASGFNVATSARRGDRRLLAVVMGGFTAHSRDAHMTTLLDNGFQRLALQRGRDWVAAADVSANVPPLLASVSADLVPRPGATPGVMLASAVAGEPAMDIAAVNTAAVDTTAVDTAAVDTAAVDTARAEATERLVAAFAPASPTYAEDSGLAEGSLTPRDPIRDLMRRDAASTPADAVASSGAWAVQVGAFQDPDQARQLASRAADYLASPAPVAITELATRERTVFRARLVNFEQEQAHSACQRLQQRGLECLVVAATP